MIADASFHGRGNAQRLMNPDVVVMENVKRNHRDVVLNLFAERIGQAGEPTHLHPHGQILPLYKTGADVRRIRLTIDHLAFAPDAHRWAVALLALTRIVVDLD